MVWNRSTKPGVFFPQVIFSLNYCMIRSSFLSLTRTSTKFLPGTSSYSANQGLTWPDSLSNITRPVSALIELNSSLTRVIFLIRN